MALTPIDKSSTTNLHQIAEEYDARATLERRSSVFEGDDSLPMLRNDLYNLVQASRHEDLFVFKVPVSVIMFFII